ncbi:MAG TPA: hypothetical protein DHV05_03095, partial [Acholeplasmataceae bacterium]|nr:hypothetical protein [Acholeplasmataceae bacterium]
MKSISLYLKRNLYFILSIFALFSTVVLAVVLLLVLDLSRDVSKTSVGFIYLGASEVSDYESVLAPRIAQWQDTADYTLTYQEYEWQIDLTHFEFDLNQTLTEIKENQNNDAYFTLSEVNRDLLISELTEDLTPLIISSFDEDSFLSELENDLRVLKNRKSYELKDYLDAEIASTTIDQVDMDDIPVDIVSEISSVLSEFVISAQSRFYLIEALDTYSLSNEALSVIASALQYMTVKTPVEGYIYQEFDERPIWSGLGMSARVLALNGYDFSFFNPRQEEMRVTIEVLDTNTLRFTLKGYPFLTTYERIIELGPTIYYHVITNDNPLLNELSEGVIITDTETETIYEVVIVTGVHGHVTYIKRRVTPLGGTYSD